ncbi:MAG: substrate-binding periplasmic protein, partial [Pseudoalteromonas sp.]
MAFNLCILKDIEFLFMRAIFLFLALT